MLLNSLISLNLLVISLKRLNSLVYFRWSILLLNFAETVIISLWKIIRLPKSPLDIRLPGQTISLVTEISSHKFAGLVNSLNQ